MPQQTELEQALQIIETTLRQLESQYNMYFTGQLPRPPFDTRRRLEQMLARLDRGYITSSADRFRLGSLQSRYAMFSERWDRAVRAREEGRPGPFSRSASRAAPPADAATPAADPVTPEGSSETGAPAPETPPGAASGDRTFGTATLTGEGTEPDRVRALYESLIEARKAVGAAESFPFSRFADIVKGQVAKFQQSGSDRVAFCVSTRDGRVVFTAQGRKASEDNQSD